MWRTLLALHAVTVLAACATSPSDVGDPCADNTQCLSGNCSITSTGGLCTVALGGSCADLCRDPYACAVPGNTCEQSCIVDADCPLLHVPVSGAIHQACVRYPGQRPGESGWCRIPCGSSAAPGAHCLTNWVCDPWTPPAGSEWPAPAFACAPI